MPLFSRGCSIGRRLGEDNISEADRLAMDRTKAIALLLRLGAA
jgi:hypothetical protein